MADPIPFAILGTGWRALFYLRIAKLYPEHFRVTGLVSRNGNPTVEAEFKVRSHRTLDDLLRAERPRFVVTSLPWTPNPDAIKELVDRGLPVLTETPPAPTLESMRDLCAHVKAKKGRVQVAEQVHLRPHHQAQMAVAASGKLGNLHDAYISVSHGYHGISLMRRFLGLTFENATISGQRVKTPMVQGPGRDGAPKCEKIVETERDFYFFDFGDKHGVVDFTGSQYFAWIRNEHLQLRGERGELVNDRFSWLQDFQTPRQGRIERVMDGVGGLLNPLCLSGYQTDGGWIYRNPFTPHGMMDDEIAIAEALVRMDAHAAGGPDFYSLAEGCQDHYLWLQAQDAVKTGAKLPTATQHWADA